MNTLLALLLLTQAAAAQPAGMGSPQDMGARPLMVDDLPAGTITVRVGRGSLSKSAVGVDVVATLTGRDGKVSNRTETVKSDGRATFSDLPVGAEFQAEAVVDGESLQTSSFAIPTDGGVRLMLVSTGKPGDETQPADPHGGHSEPMAEPTMGGLIGDVAPKEGLAAGTLDLRLVGPDGTAIAGQEIKLGRAAKSATDVAWVNSSTDQDGKVRFPRLETGDTQFYMALVERDGMRLGSERFQLLIDRGSAGELRVPGRSKDTSILRVADESKILIDLREEAVEVMENLVMENTSDQIFQPEPKGLSIPLPAEANNVGSIEGSNRLEVSEATALFLREAIPPASPDQVPVQARFGFLMPTGGHASLIFRQPMPFGMENPVIMLPESAHLDLSGPNRQTMAPQADDRGGKMQIYRLASVPRNGVLTFTVSGLPTRGKLGSTIAGVLALMLFLAAALGLRRPEPCPAAVPLASQREKLMNQLVEVERARQTGDAKDATLDSQRADLLTALAAMDNKLNGDAGS